MTDAERIIAEIEAAFPPAAPPPLPKNYLGIDAMSCFEFFGGRLWTEIEPPDLFWEGECLIYLPDEWFYCYVPAFLRAAVVAVEVGEGDTDITLRVVNAFAIEVDQRLLPIRTLPYIGFDGRQCLAIHSVLEYLARQIDWPEVSEDSLLYWLEQGGRAPWHFMDLEVAFAGSKLPSPPARRIDGPTGRCMGIFGPRDWRSIPEHDLDLALECFSWLTRTWSGYYLPAYLAWALRLVRSGSMAKGEELCRWLEEQIGELIVPEYALHWTAEQDLAVASCLEELAEASGSAPLQRSAVALRNWSRPADGS